MGPTGFPETSVSSYQSTLRKFTEELRPEVVFFILHFHIQNYFYVLDLVLFVFSLYCRGK
jgi:hypothetical protein